MEKLLELLNEYEDSRWDMVDDGLTEEEREEGAVIENTPRWREYRGHLRVANASTVAFERDTFDAYALSKKYGFIRWLNDRDMLKPKEIYQQAILDQIKEGHEWEAYTQWLALSDNPISDLISMLR